MNINQPCWIGIDTGLNVLCRLVYISDTHASVVVPERVRLPPTFDLYFRADGKVGRRCNLLRQSGDKADLLIVGRMEAREDASSDTFEV
jgi:hypothetical protein